MGKMFDMDNPVWRFMGKVTDMFFLTCLWLLFSLPVVTIGAATCALCYCSMTLASNKEGYIREDFVRAFKENFKSATIAWIGMLALGIFFGADLYFLDFSGAVGDFCLRCPVCVPTAGMDRRGFKEDACACVCDVV